MSRSDIASTRDVVPGCEMHERAYPQRFELYGAVGRSPSCVIESDGVADVQSTVPFQTCSRSGVSGDPFQFIVSIGAGAPAGAASSRPRRREASAEGSASTEYMSRYAKRADWQSIIRSRSNAQTPIPEKVEPRVNCAAVMKNAFWLGQTPNFG